MVTSANRYPLVKDGCVIYRDLTGYSFGRLYVLSRVVREKRETGTRNTHWWKCRCVCGGIHFVDTDPLVDGHTQSCGCLSGSRSPLAHCPAFRAIIIDHRINTTKPTAEIGRYFGLTKNAVIGILDRAGMSVKDDPEPLTIEQRLGRFTFPTSRQCAYPNGVPFEEGFSWCNEPVKPESSYCPEHHARCFIDESKARDRTASIATADLTQQRPKFTFGKQNRPASITAAVEAD